jgi:ribosomal protein S18 acetylase RimI-like enzyme
MASGDDSGAHGELPRHQDAVGRRLSALHPENREEGPPIAAQEIAEETGACPAPSVGETMNHRASATMITGRWGRPSQVLLDLVVEPDGAVRGVANPGKQNAPIRLGRFDAATGAVTLEGEHARPDGTTLPFHIAGHLEGRTLRLAYQFGDIRGHVDVVRVEEYRPRLPTRRDRLQVRVAGLKRWINARWRPTGQENARALRARGESVDSIVFRDAVAADIPALAELHVTTWNATYRTTRGPTIATRTAQWNQVFAQASRRDFVLVLEDRNGRLVGFAWGRPHDGECEGELSKIYLRWEYHGLGLGRRMMAETARRFLERGIRSFVLFAELSNPTLGFYDRMAGERLRDDRGLFSGAYAWRDVRTLLGPEAAGTSQGEA